MGKISKFAHQLSYIFDNAARWVTVALMLLVVINVILRPLGHPIPGSVEWIEFLTAMSVGLALGYCGAQGGHVALTFVVEKLTKKSQVVIDLIIDLVVAVFLIFCFWRIFDYANNLRVSGQVSLTSAFPYYPFVYVVALGFISYCLVMIGSVVESIVKLMKSNGKTGIVPSTSGNQPNNSGKAVER